MSRRVCFSVITAILAGCALQGCAVLSALSDSDCWYGMAPGSHPLRCMTYAEYQAARGIPEKPATRFDLKAALDEQREDERPAPRFKDWIP